MNAKGYLPLAALLLAFASCSKPQTDTQAPADNSAGTETAAAPDAAPVPPAVDESTNAGAAFAAKSESSPFANADLALKETYNRALIAHQIGDYTRAASELQDLATDASLTADQRRAVQDLLAQVQAASPSAVSNLASVPQPAPPGQFAVAQVPAGESAQTAPDAVFSTADPAVRESFARAKTAHAIGNYAAALSELQDLATNSQLNAEQKYAVQSLLDKTPQTVPGVTSPK